MTSSPRSRFNTALIVYNPIKEGAEEVARQSEEILRQEGLTAWRFAYRPFVDTFKESNHRLQVEAQRAEVILVLGGDGTILGVARQTAETPRPLLGVNLGAFGFLTSSTLTELESTLQCLVTGDYRVVNRYLLEARVYGDAIEGEREVFHSYALNEALITLAHPGRLLRIWVGDTPRNALAYRADGLIVATPTGSTGHSLSAGGPILEPDIPALIITPVSPHSLFNRPLVISGEKDISLWFEDNKVELLLILDGQIQAEVTASNHIRIRRSKCAIPTLSLPDRTFTQVLRYKFNLGHSS